MKTIITLAIALLLAPAGVQDIVDILPPDGTPQGWSKSGAANTYGPGDVAAITDTPDAYTANGLQTAIEQVYTDGSDSITVRIFEMSGSADAYAAFEAAAAGNEITSDLGQGTVLKAGSILFTNGNYVIHVVGGSGLSQQMAVLAMTMDAYLA